MKKVITLILILSLALGAAAILSSCGSSAKTITIAIPNDTTNEARALLLLQNAGIIKVDGTKGLTATINDITDNPKNIKFVEVDAAQVPQKKADVDYAVINTNYALAAGLNPTKDALSIEGSASAYANILSVKAGNENDPKTLALKAALESKQVADFIAEKYKGSVVSVVENPGTGYADGVDYEALNGTTIKVSATPEPHAEILEEAKKILAAKGITLEIITTTDYAVPNKVTEDGSVDANYFQHTPYMDSFNEEQGTHIVSVAAIHVEPMGLYGGKQTTLDPLK